MGRLRMLVAAAGVVGALLLLAWTGDIRQPNLLEQVQRRGELVVGTRVSPSTYYDTDAGARGFEYDLARRFADELGVALRMHAASSLNALAQLLDSGSADLVADGATASPSRLRRFDFSEPYLQVHPQLVYRAGNRQPEDLGDLSAQPVDVVAASTHEQLLASRQNAYPGLTVRTLADATGDDLLYRVWDKRTSYAVVDSNELALNRNFYPELRAAFDIGEPRALAWMFRPGDRSLLATADAFFERIRNDGTLAALIERHYGHLDEFDYVGARVFMRHVTERLPRFREVFREAGAEELIDWRLLAAVGYQESHWDPQAVSYTGVRGVMMLTRSTAREVGIEDRLDPVQSIRGGARYLASLLSRLPEDIPARDRMWLAVAAYNIGLGHVRDARVITEMQQADPHSWPAVKNRLPLLEQEQWYSRVRYGRARGWEAVRYVENIRRYYQLLIRVTEPGLLNAGRQGTPSSGKRIPPAVRLGGGVESAF